MPKKIQRPMKPMAGNMPNMGMRPPMGGNPMMGGRPPGMGMPGGMPQRPPMGGGQPQGGQREPMVPLSVANKMVVDALQAANGKAQPQQRPPQR